VRDGSRIEEKRKEKVGWCGARCRPPIQLMAMLLRRALSSSQAAIVAGEWVREEKGDERLAHGSSFIRCTPPLPPPPLRTSRHHGGMLEHPVDERSRMAVLLEKFG
jgi:hypothetical protein